MDAKGTISARNKYGMAVETNADTRKGTSEDIWVTFHKQLKLIGFKDLSELGEGDKVSVRYKLTNDTKKILLMEIALLKKKPAEKPPATALVSEEVKVTL